MHTQATPLNAEPEYAAFIAIDWADRKHDWAMQAAGQSKRETGQLEHTPEAIHQWVTGLRQRFGGRRIAVALEQSRGALLFSLSKYDNLVLYPIHPATASSFRKALHPSGSKDDVRDADVQLELLLKHRDRLQVWKPDTEQTRELQFLVEDRRRLVEQKTALLNQLTARLKLYFPQLLSWFASADSVLLWRVLAQWPDLEALQRAPRGKLKKVLEQEARSAPADVEAWIERARLSKPATHDAAVVRSAARFAQAAAEQLQWLRSTIQQYEKRIQEIAGQHPEFAVMSSFPGAGKALVPRLIAALGTQRERFADAASLQAYSGIAPVREASGRREWVHARWACPKFVKQTFQEWAQHSLSQCEWARAHYEKQRASGKQHHAAIRSVAYKWIRILYRCWIDRTPYDDTYYSRRQRERSSVESHQAAPVTIVWKTQAGFSKPALI